MSLWSMISSKIKEVISKMIGSRTIEQTLKVTPSISSQMEEAIQLWSDMYKNKAPWLKEPTYNNPTRIVSLGLPAMIASEKARTALLEFKSEITVPKEEDDKQSTDSTPSIDKKSSEKSKDNNEQRAEFLNSQYNKLKRKLRTQIEYGIAKGGLIIKPYVVEIKDSNGGKSYELEFDFCQADCFYPLSFNASGTITEAAFLQTIIKKDIIYRRLEYHKYENSVVTIINKAYKSTSNNTDDGMTGVDLGQEVQLTEVPEWSELQPEVRIKDVKKPLFAYFKMPQANTIDTSSPLGVSAYQRAIGLIKDADMQYSRLLWEYEGGELAIDIDRDALNFETDGQGNTHSVMSTLQQRLYRKVDIETDGSTYYPYAPALRDANYLQGLNAILMRIEDAVELSRGTLSDAASEARTATELKILKQRSYQANADLQQAIQEAIEDTIYACNVYCTLYKMTPEGKYEVSYDWDDSILVDVDTELGKQLSLLQNGLTTKRRIIMWYNGMTEEQADELLEEIQKESTEAMEQNMMAQKQLGDDEDDEDESKRR